jgi:hypothetical protein
MVETNTTTDVVNLLLGIANNIGLSLSSWNPLGVGRAIVQSVATVYSMFTNTAAFLAQGAYAGYAAQMRNADGSDVTQWLDLRGVDQYNLYRNQPTYAACASTGFSVTTTGTAGGTFQIGQFHVASPSSGATYSNTAVVTFNANTTTPCAIQADVPGTSSNAAIGTITQLVTPIAGATCSNSAPLTGTNIETNAAYFNRCVLKLGSISPSGPSAAYDYVVQTYTQTDPNGVRPAPPWQLTGGAITRSFTRANATTGVVTTTAGNSTGTVSGGYSSITNVTSLGGNTYQITTSTPHNLAAGSQFVVTGCVGANGLNYAGTAATVWTVLAYVDANDFTVNVGAITVGAYTSGGTVYGGDLGLCNYLIQANAVGQGITATVQSIQSIAISPTCTVYYKKISGLLPGAIQAKVSTALQSYFASVPVGGVSDSTPDDSVCPYSGIVGAIMATDPSITSVVFSATQALYVVPPPLSGSPYYTQTDVSMLVSSQPVGVPVLGLTANISAVPK